MQRESNLSNAALMARRQAAIPRGVGHSHPVFIARGDNAEVWDVEGKRYVDFAGGIAVLNTGHRHPAVVAAVKAQLELYTHTCFQVLAYEPYVELAERINALAPGDFAKKTIFLTTGSEAVENAVKIARAYTKRAAVIAFTSGYHGRTLLTLGLTGKVAPYKTGFGPFPVDIFHAQFPDLLHGVSIDDAIASVESIFKNDVEASRVAAIIVEPVQGEGAQEPLHRRRARPGRHGGDRAEPRRRPVTTRCRPGQTPVRGSKQARTHFAVLWHLRQRDPHPGAADRQRRHRRRGPGDH